MKEIKRCPWAKGSNPEYVAYHDEEWGRASHDDIHLFEMLILEGAQAGLSWETILKRREGYRKAFSGFDPKKVAAFTPDKVEKLMRDEGIIRNRLKIESAILNAKAFLTLQKEFGSFDKYLWGWVDFKPLVNRPRAMNEVPAKTALSDQISKDLKKRGFKFIGSTIIYAFMQAVGVVDDHLVDCANKGKSAKKRE